MKKLPNLGKIVDGRISSAIEGRHGEDVIFSKAHKVDDSCRAGTLHFRSVRHLHSHPQRLDSGEPYLGMPETNGTTISLFEKSVLRLVSSYGSDEV